MDRTGGRPGQAWSSSVRLGDKKSLENRDIKKHTHTHTHTQQIYHKIKAKSPPTNYEKKSFEK